MRLLTYQATTPAPTNPSGPVRRRAAQAAPPRGSYSPPTGMPYPRCAICRHEVRRMDHWQDPVTHELVFRVRCHGREDVIRMPAVPPAPGAHFTLGEAFQSKLPTQPVTPAFQVTALNETTRHTTHCGHCHDERVDYGTADTARIDAARAGWAVGTDPAGDVAWCPACRGRVQR